MTKPILPKEMLDLRRLWEQYDSYGGHHEADLLVAAVPRLLKEIDRIHETTREILNQRSAAERKTINRLFDTQTMVRNLQAENARLKADTQQRNGDQSWQHAK